MANKDGMLIERVSPAKLITRLWLKTLHICFIPDVAFQRTAPPSCLAVFVSNVFLLLAIPTKHSSESTQPR